MKLSREELKNKLALLQYKVTWENGTELAFQNEFGTTKGKEGVDFWASLM